MSDLDNTRAGIGRLFNRDPHYSPAFVRIPKDGTRCPFSGLTRSAMFAFIRQGKVKSHCVSHPGAKRGIRLIDAASLKAAIQSFDSKPTTQQEEQ